MLEAFGDEYAAYMTRTKLLLATQAIGDWACRLPSPGAAIGPRHESSFVSVTINPQVFRTHASETAGAVLMPGRAARAIYPRTL